MPAPGDALPPPPQRGTTARKSARCRAGAGSPRPQQPRPGNTGCGPVAACPKGRAAGGGTAPDTRRPSQRWRANPPGRASHHPRGTQPLTGHANQRDSAGPRRPHTRAHSTWVADADSPPRGWAAGGGRDVPHNGARHPPRGCPPATSTARNHGSQEHTLWDWCWVPTPTPTAPGNHRSGRGTLAACPKGRAAGEGTAPDTRRPSQQWIATRPGTASNHPRGTQPLAGHASQRDSAGYPRPHTRAHSTCMADLDSPPRGRAAGGGRAPELRRPPQRRKAPPPETPSRHPHSAQRRLTRVHAVGLVLGRHANTNRTRETRVA